MTIAPQAKRESATAGDHWLQWIEPWYLAYALLGATAAGLVPILLPLVVSRTAGVTHVGLVMATLGVGGLTAPLWGHLADRFRIHRWMLAGGLLVVAAGLTGFASTKSPITWLGLALLQGIGTAGAATVANLFVVEAYPEDEWDARISWLQAFYGVGQVGGLVLAGLLSQARLDVGLWTAAGLSALAIVPGWFTTQIPPDPLVPRPVLLQPAQHGEWSLGSPQRTFPHMTLRSLRQLGPTVRSPFGLFLAVWLAAFSGSSAVFSLYPLLMQRVFEVRPWLSSLAFAAAGSLGLGLYSPAGYWCDRLGPAWVLRAALGVRLLAFLTLSGLGLAHVSGRGWLALLSFAVVILAWSPLSVSGTALTAGLSPSNKGTAMGMFNAATSMAGVIGAASGGWVAARWSYNATFGLAVLGILVGLALAFGCGAPAREDEW